MKGRRLRCQPTPPLKFRKDVSLLRNAEKKRPFFVWSVSELSTSGILQDPLPLPQHGIVKNRKYNVDLISFIQKITACLYRRLPCLLRRISEDSGRNERKADGGASGMRRTAVPVHYAFRLSRRDRQHE